MATIYLDNAATTKVDKNVAEKVKKVFLDSYANPSSQHSCGKEARKLVETAREEIANFIGANPSEIIFTSGGTESNNLAIRGLAKANPEKKHIITSVIEHPSVLETCKDLEKQGFSVDYIGVNEEGIVEGADVKKKIRKDTLLVSIMHVNNEIGTIQPIEEIGEVCKKKGVYFHSDCVQGFMKLGIDVRKMHVDLLSVSGHKVHAPKGIGFLYVRKGVRVSAVQTGGGQENGLRSGTGNVPGIVGLAAALSVKQEVTRIRKVRDLLVKELLKIPGTRINGSLKKRIWNNVNVSFYGIEGESLMLMLDKEGICVSTGSACASNKLSESYVLKAIKVPELYIHGSLRLTLGEISEKDIKFVVSKINEKVEKLRKISPFKLEMSDGK
ncbi:cysteine desulfurase [archaeon]|jgi:cysteine desulfurase|nr:cysteine desulfurase [archaeon]MBT3577205.1 cysteine desulfurase [archaeon]MBT6820214.1 cysteine desulfurase [archaeon]MBT6956754.1 cysteine desulfurase [archaeon]MBT7025419.1 cysteine desulfurase [archaeon]